jgi:linoleate 10R-lipoxygenase
MNVKAVNATGWISGIVDPLHQNKSYLTDYGVHMVRKLLESGMSPGEITYSQILPTAVAMVPNQAQVFTQALDYYLSPAGNKHLPEIHRLAKLDTAEADEKILRYCMEGIRINGTFGSYREAATATTINDGGRKVSIKPGDKVFLSIVGANHDPAGFPDPDEVKLDRPMSSYVHYGVGPHACLGTDASRVALTAMLKTVGKLNNLRPAPGPKGQLKKVPRPGGFYVYMKEDYGSYFPFPLSWQVNWDGELPPLKH